MLGKCSRYEDFHPYGLIVIEMTDKDISEKSNLLTIILEDTLDNIPTIENGDDADISLTIHFRKENWIQDGKVWYREDLFCVWNSDMRSVDPLNFWRLQSEIVMEAERYEEKHPEIVMDPE